MDLKYSPEDIKEIINSESYISVLDEIKSESFVLVLPTGFGKTYIIAIYLLKLLNKEAKGLFLTPTNILTNQQYELFKELTNYNVKRIYPTDDTFPDLNQADIFFTTIHLANSRKTKQNLNKYDFIVFDEIHNFCTGEIYDELFRNFKGKIIGLSATVFKKTRSYLLDIRKDIQFVDRTSKKKENIIISYIPTLLVDSQILILNKLAFYLRKNLPFENLLTLFNKNSLQVSDLLTLPSSYQRMRLIHYLLAYFYLSSQIPSTYNNFIKKYFNKLEIEKLSDFSDNYTKIEVIINFLKNNFNEKTIIFAEYIETINQISKSLNKEGLEHTLLIGKSNKNSNQIKALNEFKDKVKILLTTKVGEEGLDIGDAYNLIFFEPIVNKRRIIQRIGRIGRRNPEGNILILGYKNTLEDRRANLLLNFLAKDEIKSQ